MSAIGDYLSYLQDIADRPDASPDDFIAHMRKHLLELDEKPLDENWVASMENLIMLLKLSSGIFPSTLVKLERLYAHEEKNVIKTVRINRSPAEFLFGVRR